MRQSTYCNPLSIPDVGSGRWLDTDLGKEPWEKYADYRSISDPSVIYNDGTWILYPSYGVAWITDDFVHWKHVDIGIPHLRYSPAVAQFKGKWYLAGHGMTTLYCAEDPLGPFEVCGQFEDCHGQIFAPVDACFLADDDHLYMYWIQCKQPETEDDVELVTYTVGVELNPEKPWQMLHEPVKLNRFEPDVEWQRMGEHHQNRRMGWIEGQWAKKIGNRYYLMYSGSGTEFSTYANGIAISDEGPLSGFRPQKNHDPFTYKRHGLIKGAGHGCLTDGPNGTMWTFYTCTFCFNHMFERRICMDPVGIDADGELYCPEMTETPQFAPGMQKNPENGNDAGWLPLTFMQRPFSTSHAPGREPIYASDESMLTWWQPDAADKQPVITFRLGSSTRYCIRSVRLIWRDIGMETMKNIMPGPFKYVIEYAPDAKLSTWKMLIDATENTEDLCIDYRETEAVGAYGIRLRILGAPAGITPGLVSMTAFGNVMSGIE